MAISAEGKLKTHGRAAKRAKVVSLVALERRLLRRYLAVVFAP